MENANHAKNKCHDCGKEIIIENGEIKNGYQLLYEEDIKVFKCSSCYKKSPSLSNFRSCEVYSRVVGYIRPVQQWNAGKREEYAKREDYNI